MSKRPIIFVGGGTAGPVAPLLAVAGELRRRDAKWDIRFITTSNGPELSMVSESGFPSYKVPAPKLDRFWSLRNLALPLTVPLSLFRAVRLVRSISPGVVCGAGGYVQVPVIWAAWLLGVPTLIHQQDVRPSLSNRLCRLWASAVTVSLKESVPMFSGRVLGILRPRAVPKVTGNPSRLALVNLGRAEARRSFGLDPERPAVLVLGGGTGAAALNELVKKSWPLLEGRVSILHATGRGKGVGTLGPGYVGKEFITDMATAYSAADLVVCRGGFSTTTELSHFGKAAMIIPIPATHQEDNAQMLKASGAALVFDQRTLTPTHFASEILRVIGNQTVRNQLEAAIARLMPANAAQRLAEVVERLAG